MSIKPSYDTLTSLLDRASFLSHLRTELGQQVQRQSAIILINLDDFRSINNRLGHTLGDEILKLVVQHLLAAKRNHDVLARLNGDEFALLVTDISHIEELDSLAERLLEIIATPYEINGQKIILTCSIGISIFVCNGPEEINHILQNAETALCQAKEEGKNSYRHFAVNMHTSIRRRVAISNALQLSVQAGFSDFSLLFQPKLGLASGNIVGVEALLRWHTEELGHISPCEFIPIAEQHGIIIQIGAWVLLQACQQAVIWHKQFKTPLSLAVNLSARQFRDSNLIHTVTEALKKTGLSPQQLELELTETMLMHDIPKTIKTLNELNNLGINLAIDDFGTGYSSLGYLKDFPLDYLKVDRSFVAQLQNNSKEKAIVQSIISLAHLLDLKVIAEGVENHDQLNFLLAQDCDEIQGYLFSPPVSAEAISTMISKHNGLDGLLNYPSLS